MGGRPLAAQQSGSAKHQRPGADRGHVSRRRGEAAQFAEKDLVIDGIVRGAAAARNANDIAFRDVGEPPHPGKNHPASGLDRAALGARHDDRGAGQRREHLVRPGEVELRHAGKQREDYNRWRSLMAKPSASLTPVR